MGTIKLQIPLSGNVFVGPARLEVQKAWPRTTVSVRTQELVDAIATTCRREGIKGVSIRTYAANRHGVECLNGQFLIVELHFPKNVSIYQQKLIVSEGMFTRDLSLYDIKKPLQAIFSKHNIHGGNQFTFSSFAGIHDGAEITV